MKKTIIFSGINISEGGTLAIYEYMLDYIYNSPFVNKYRIIALVYSTDLFDKYSDKIELIEFKKSKKTWFHRLYYEYFYFYKLSKKLNPYIWISMHDITPRVAAEKRVVYCQTDFLSCKLNFTQAGLNPKFYILTKIYKYLYKINIHKNDLIIVHRSWMYNYFIQNYPVPEKNIVLHYPQIIQRVNKNRLDSSSPSKRKDTITFIYPSFPRVYKNFELICRVAEYLEQAGKNISCKLKFLLTIDGTENRYSKFIYRKYKNVKTIHFTGRQTREELYEIYQDVDAMIFPSFLESWGLPLTEFMEYGKQIFAADLEYAHETAGNYRRICYFDPYSTDGLSRLILDFVNGKDVTEKELNNSLYSQRSSFRRLTAMFQLKFLKHFCQISIPLGITGSYNVKSQKDIFESLLE